jgi:hypothetical protein
MVSLSRRQVLIGGAVSVLLPSISFASARTEKLVLSGRVIRNGKPAAGAGFAIGGERVVTDADGRFMIVTDTSAYPSRDAHRDAEGTLRATASLSL